MKQRFPQIYCSPKTFFLRRTTGGISFCLPLKTTITQNRGRGWLKVILGQCIISNSNPFLSFCIFTLAVGEFIRNKKAQFPYIHARKMIKTSIHQIVSLKVFL